MVADLAICIPPIGVFIAAHTNIVWSFIFYCLTNFENVEKFELFLMVSFASLLKNKENETRTTAC